MTESTGRRTRAARYVAALALAAVAAVPVAAQPAQAQVVDGSGTQGWMFDTSQLELNPLPVGPSFPGY